MSFTIKATYQDQTETIKFDTAGIPPHAIINAKLRDAFGLASDMPIAWWHIYMSLGESIPGAKFLRHVCSEEEYEDAANAYRQAGVDFPNLTLTLHVLPQSNGKLTSARKFHAYMASVPSTKQLEQEQSTMQVAIFALQQQLAALVEQEDKLDEEDYQGRLLILQKRAEKMSEVATLKQNMKAVVIQLNTLNAIHKPNMPVVERELKRNREAKQETESMIQTWKNRLREQIRLRLKERIEAEKKNASVKPEAGASTAIPNRVNDTSRIGPQRVSPEPALRMPGGLPPLEPAVSSAYANAEPSRSAPSPRSLWEDHPIYGQIPSAYAAFPDIKDIPSAPGRPITVPLRTLSDLLRDVKPLSQAISIQAQATAHAAHAQVQKQVKETTGAVASDLKHVLEGFLCNLGGQLATFEEGFKERLEHAVPKQNVPSAHETAAAIPDVKPELDTKLPVSGAGRSHAKPTRDFHKDFIFHATLCDGCDKKPTLVNFKCNNCRDFDLCIDCLPRYVHNAELHDREHVFKMTIHPTVAKKIVYDSSKSAFASAASSVDKNRPISEVAVQSHDAYCDVCAHDNIKGTRYKCLQCPDWDCCANCFATADKHHPHHDLVAIRKADDHVVRKFDYKAYHPNIRCDHCETRVLGVRYKCAHPDCPDFDLCENCEASPTNEHPASHPMIKFKRPCDIDLQAYFADSNLMARSAHEQAVQTEPEEEKEDEDDAVPRAQAPSLAQLIIAEVTEDVDCGVEQHVKTPCADCAFVGHVTIPDYFCMLPNANFTKIWTMRNTGDIAIEGDYTVRLVSGHSFGSISETVTLEKVQPGGSFTIQLPHRTVPVAEQSFSGAFRLHDEQGEAFGDELEIRVQVAKPDMSELGSSSLLMPRSDPESSLASPAPATESASVQASPSIAPVPSSSGWGARTPEFSDDDCEIISVVGGPSEFELVDDSDSDF